MERRLRWVLAAMIAVFCSPFWALPFFPSADGPAHLNTAAVIGWYSSVPEFRQYFEIRWSGAGNVAADLLAAGLIKILGPVTVQRLILTLYVVALPLSIRFALLPVCRHATLFTIAAFPFVNGLFLHMGFWSFLYGVALFAFGLGLHLRIREYRGVWRFTGLAAVSLLAYLCHLAAFAALTLLGFILGAAAVLRARRDTSVPLWRRMTPLWWNVAAALPASLALALWLFQGGSSFGTETIPLATRLRLLFGMSFTGAYGPHEIALQVSLALLFGVAVIAAALSRMPKLAPALPDTFLAAFAILGALTMVLPNATAEGGYILLRVSYFAWLCVFFWLASQPWSAKAAGVLCAALLAVAVAQLVDRYPAYRRWSDRIQEYQRIASHIPARATVAEIRLAPDPTWANPTVNLSGLIALKPAVNLSHYQSRLSSFLVGYRREFPWHSAGFVLIQNPDVPGAVARQDEPQIREQLLRYDLVAVSETGWLRLYRRRDL
jgi:hypothetical protein